MKSELLQYQLVDANHHSQQLFWFFILQVTVTSVYACTTSFVLSLIIESIRYKYKIECQLNRMILKYQISYFSNVFHVDPLF